jgi:hypothetical protein
MVSGLNISRISKLFLLIAIMLLIGNTLAICRDYQDSWILEGLEIPFVLFVIVYSIAFFFEKRISWMVALALIGRTVFLLIPNLKYVWFQGTFIDQNVQYALANYLFNQGHIATGFASGQPYIATPLIHVSFSIFSTILNVPVVDSMKYLPVLWSLMYTLLTYVILRAIGFPRGILKYVLFFSSVPFSAEQYTVTGSLFGFLLAFLILSTIVQIFQKSDRRYWIICTIFVFALAAAHSVTSVILAVSLLAIMLLERVWHFGKQSYWRASIPLVVTLIVATWLMFLASTTLQTIVNTIFVSAPRGMTPHSDYISPTFFEHLRVNPLSAARSFIVFYGATALSLVLTLVALLFLVKWRKKLNNAANFILVFGWFTLFLIVAGYLMKVGAPRAVDFAGLLFPVFAGVVVLRIGKKEWVRKLILPVIFSAILLLATIQLYGCQPLISSANVLYKEVPAEVPISYVNVVNSIYQRQMIEFATNHIKGIIAAVDPTASQIVGLAGTNFSIANLVSYYPIDKNQAVQKYDFFLINLPGKSGGPPQDVQPALQATKIISEYIQNSSIVYTNGESFVLAHR